MQKDQVVAVFGATGGTGKCVVAAALQEGYSVQALVRTPSKVEKYEESDRLKVIQGDLSDENAIQETIKGTTYVVCVAGGKPHGDEEVNKDMMQKFIRVLWPLLEQESSVKYFLYQAGALCPKPDGTNAWIIKLMRPIVGVIVGISEMVEDNTQVIRFIDEKQKDTDNKPKFQTIVIRPGILKDQPGGVTLEGSERPSFGPTSYADLGDFIVLKAMKDDTLVGKYPFVSPISE